MAKDQSERGQGTRVYVLPNWEAETPVEYHQYFADTIQQFLSTSEPELGQIMESLRSLSVGPLRFVEEGICSEEDLPEVVNRILDSSQHVTHQRAGDP